MASGWRQDIRQGFEECFRVLKPYGTLIFKWSEVQVTHWLVFMKQEMRCG